MNKEFEKIKEIEIAEIKLARFLQKTEKIKHNLEQDLAKKRNELSKIIEKNDELELTDLHKKMIVEKTRHTYLNDEGNMNIYGEELEKIWKCGYEVYSFFNIDSEKWKRIGKAKKIEYIRKYRVIYAECWFALLKKAEVDRYENY